MFEGKTAMFHAVLNALGDGLCILDETVEGTLKMLRRLIGENIVLEWIPCPAPATVRVDPTQVDQILANLVVNARDAISQAGQVVIETINAVFDEAWCARRPNFLRGEFIGLSVSDDGCGIDSGTMAHVFEPYSSPPRKPAPEQVWDWRRSTASRGRTRISSPGSTPSTKR